MPAWKLEPTWQLTDLDEEVTLSVGEVGRPAPKKALPKARAQWDC